MRGEAGLRSVPRSGALPALVVACALTPQQQARLTDAVRGRAEVRVAATFDELLSLVRGTVETIDVIVVPARDASGTEAPRCVRTLLAERPRTAVVAYCHAGSQYSSDIRALAAAGVHDFVFAGIEDATLAFRAVLDRARRQCAADWVMAQLAPLVPSALHPMIEAALQRPDTITTIAALSAALGVHRKTLFNRCEQANFLPPAELLAWTRLALVGYLLENTGCTVETIALQLGFPSDTALRNLMKRYTGQRAGEIREQGGVQGVLRALQRRLRPPATDVKHLHLV